MTTTIVPWRVGETAAVAVVGIQGPITAKTDDTITIAGFTLPTRLSDTVRHLSMVWPDDADDRCTRDHVDDGNPHECGHEGVDFLLSAVESEHIDAGHDGAFRFCGNPVCKAAQEVALP